MTSKLISYGLGISIISIGGSIWFEKQIQNRYRNEDYFKNAVSLLQKYEPGAQILGRPIFSGKLNLGNVDEVHITPLSAKISIPLKGSKENGFLHVVASRRDQSSDSKWNVDQLDLEVKSTGQRWMFYDGKKVQKGEAIQAQQPSSTL